VKLGISEKDFEEIACEIGYAISKMFEALSKPTKE